MANQEEVSGFSSEEEEWIKAQRARKARRAKGGRRGDDSKAMNINSLMDILVILLVFLLKSYGDEPVKVTGEDLQVPKSTTKLTPEDMTTITVTRSAIMVNDKKCKGCDIKGGEIDRSQKKGGESGLQIQPVYDDLKESVEQKKRQVKLLNQKYDPVVTIIADQTTPYRLITEVMYTAGQAELSKFKFAVIQGERSEISGQ
ncbi:MAG: ExbD/TolR family protein [Persicimonas sp.]